MYRDTLAGNQGAQQAIHGGKRTPGGPLEERDENLIARIDGWKAREPGAAGPMKAYCTRARTVGAGGSKLGRKREEGRRMESMISNFSAVETHHRVDRSI